MLIQKENRRYQVIENAKSWTVKRTEDKITISYNVPKQLCGTFRELEIHVKNSDLF